MSRDELVDKFDECFGISTATEAQRKKFFDWVMAQQQSAQQSVQATSGWTCLNCGWLNGDLWQECPNCKTTRA